MNIFEKIFQNCNEDVESFFKTTMKNPVSPSGLTSIEEYKKIENLGEGSFGKVFKACHKKTKEIYAVKEFKSIKENDCFDILTVREIKILKSLDHENIVKLKDICYKHKYNNKGYKANFYLVFELCDQTLFEWISKNTNFPHPHSIMKQTLLGINYIHENNLIHRDLKPENILIDAKGIIKIADFGWTRLLKCPKNGLMPEYTPHVVTLWYRSPELLLKDPRYDQSVDIWSLGCIFVEMFIKNAIFRGSNEINQLTLIFKFCGTIDKEDWPHGYELLNKNGNPTRARLGALNEYLGRKIQEPDIKSFIISMLSLNPAKRPTAKSLLKERLFCNLIDSSNHNEK